MTSSPREVTVTETEVRLRQRIEAGRHVLVSDEPREAGGSDAGPDPYALLLAALGACTSMTLRLYADHKKWPLEGIVVRLTHERTYARDCEDCEKSDSRIDRIFRSISLSGPLSEEQRLRLIEIAERCPVHRTLAGPKEIVTRLAEP
jgi:putative redox protein